MDAALVAAPGNVQVRAQGNAERSRLLVHLFEQTHRTSLRGSRFAGNEQYAVLRELLDKLFCVGQRLVLGDVELARKSSPERSRESGVAPSAAFQMAVPTAFNMKIVESRVDMMMVSSPSVLACDVRALRDIGFG